VEVEADIGCRAATHRTGGLPSTVLVGPPDSALYQARDRCKAADRGADPEPQNFRGFFKGTSDPDTHAARTRTGTHEAGRKLVGKGARIAVMARRGRCRAQPGEARVQNRKACEPCIARLRWPPKIRMMTFWPGLAGLIVLGVVVAILALGYFVWVFYQLVVLGAT
jgi:hypothetical protein